MLSARQELSLAITPGENCRFDIATYRRRAVIDGHHQRHVAMSPDIHIAAWQYTLARARRACAASATPMMFIELPSRSCEEGHIH